MFVFLCVFVCACMYVCVRVCVFAKEWEEDAGGLDSVNKTLFSAALFEVVHMFCPKDNGK